MDEMEPTTTTPAKRKPRGKAKRSNIGAPKQKLGGHRKNAPARVPKTTPTRATTAGLAVITESKPRKSPAMKSVTVESPIKEGLVECFKELETQVNNGITQEQMQHLVIKLFNRNKSGTKATTASTAKENTVPMGQVFPPSNSNTREAANDSSL